MPQSTIMTSRKRKRTHLALMAAMLLLEEEEEDDTFMICMVFLLTMQAGMCAAAALAYIHSYYGLAMQDLRFWGSTGPKKKRAVDHDQCWWYHIQKHKEQNEQWFVENLRVSVHTFDVIYKELYRIHESKSKRKRHGVRKRFERKVALFLAYCSSPDGYRQLKSVFGGGMTEICESVNLILEYMQELYPKYVSMPSADNPEAWKTLARQFEMRTGFPDTVGAIDGTLIRMKKAANDDTFFCRKGFPSLNVQAVCDNNRKFMSIAIRSGSTPDCSVFSRSVLGKNIETTIPRGMHLVGDGGYSLRSFMMTPYPSEKKDEYSYYILEPEERHYNYVHSVTRMVIEMAFGILKMRWRVLKYELPFTNHASNVKLIVACVVLHNICIYERDNAYIEAHPITEEDLRREREEQNRFREGVQTARDAYDNHKERESAGGDSDENLFDEENPSELQRGQSKREFLCEYMNSIKGKIKCYTA